MKRASSRPLRKGFISLRPRKPGLPTRPCSASFQQQLGGQPSSIISGAADEILAVLKNETFKNADKKKEIEKNVESYTQHRL